MTIRVRERAMPRAYKYRPTKFCEACSKRGHPSMGEAVKVALRNSVEYGMGFRTYYCRHSGMWHTTRKKKREA